MPYQIRGSGSCLTSALPAVLLWAALPVGSALSAAEPATVGPDQPRDLPAEAQREAFLAAEAALDAGALDRYLELAGDLSSYPLYCYLRYRQLDRAPGRPSDSEVRQYLADYPDNHLADRLRASWLKRLAAEGRWAEYAEAYRPDGSEDRQCLYRRALLTIGRDTDALTGLEPLWLRADAGPDACGPVFDAWAAAGGLTPELVWQRIALAMGADRPKLAADIGRYLPPAEAPYLDLWLALHRDPTRISDPVVFADPHPTRDNLMAHAVARLAVRSPQSVAEAWDRLRAAYPLAAPAVGAAETAVGLALAEAGNAAGLARLDQMPPTADNLDIQGRRLRAALALGDWARVATWVAAMPDGEDKADLWCYWQARAEEAQGHAELAQDIYRQAAGARSLWGFLAAERVGLPYHLDPRPTPLDPERVARLSNDPTLARIVELRALDRVPDMRREWARLTAGLGPEDLMAAAVIAQGLEWPDQAVRTLAKSGYWDDLELRFPLGYRDLIRAQAAATGVPEAWIYAVLREESTFDRGAGSPAGAIGLMQLMPETARSVAKAIGHRPPSRGDLLDPATNVALGSAYLAAMSARYGAHPALATAAYNAGPHRVDKWLPTAPMAADLWIATIPFRETRDYVRRVLAYRIIYADRLGVCTAPLGAALGPVASISAEATLK